jgi:transcriptional regulator of acetoin/glycerol metabolism
LSDEAKQALLRHEWPGNVRELANSIRRACLLAESRRIQVSDLVLRTGAGAGAQDAAPAREPDRAEIEIALTRADGIVARAARELGLSRQSLYRRMEKLGIAASGQDSRS